MLWSCPHTLGTAALAAALLNWLKSHLTEQLSSVAAGHWFIIVTRVLISDLSGPLVFRCHFILCDLTGLWSDSTGQRPIVPFQSEHCSAGKLLDTSLLKSLLLLWMRCLRAWMDRKTELHVVSLSLSLVPLKLLRIIIGDSVAVSQWSSLLALSAQQTDAFTNVSPNGISWRIVRIVGAWDELSGRASSRAPQGCEFKSRWVLLLEPCATGVLRPAYKPRATWLSHMAALPLRYFIS